MVDLFLYNGFTPLRRAPADVFLDNGIGVLRAYLKARKIDFVVEDRFTINDFDFFTKSDLSIPLRKLFKKVLFSGERYVGTDEHLHALELYRELMRHHDLLMEEYLRDQLALMMAGRISEKLLLGSVSSGYFSAMTSWIITIFSLKTNKQLAN